MITTIDNYIHSHYQAEPNVGSTIFSDLGKVFVGVTSSMRLGVTQSVLQERECSVVCVTSRSTSNTYSNNIEVGIVQISSAEEFWSGLYQVIQGRGKRKARDFTIDPRMSLADLKAAIRNR